MENKQLFSSIGYVVWSDFAYQDKVKVKVFFVYKEFHVRTKTLFIKKIKGKDESYYQNEAKRIINKMINDGSLKQEVEKESRKKKILTAAIPLVSAMAIAGITVGTYFGLMPKTQEVEVIFEDEVEGVSLSKNEATVGQDYDTQIILDFSKTNGKVLEDTLGEVKSGSDVISSEVYTYNVNEDKTTGTLHIPGEYVKDKVEIKVTLRFKRWNEYTDWWNYCSNGDNNIQANEKDIGKTVNVTVNNQPHLVRLIDIDKDKDSSDHFIHTTFEFLNLISDENGYSLVTQWNDTNTTGTSNYNYFDSSVRMALVGEKKFTGHILWAQKGATAWSTNPSYANKTVLSMLPSELVSVLKVPSKYININVRGSWGEQIINDKLFLLSPREMGKDGQYQETKTTTYSYYNDAQGADLVKKQVKNEPYTSIPEINYVEESGQLYKNSVHNYAGYNESTETTYGGEYWLRSPFTRMKGAWNVSKVGGFGGSTVYGYAYAIAPAFCI